jgi:integrase
MAYLDVRETKSGTRYRVKYRDEFGREKVVTFPALDQAERWRDVCNTVGHVQAMKLLEAPADPRVPTVRQVVADHIEALSGIEPGTRTDYRRHLRNDIAPYVGELAVDQLARPGVSAWVNALADRGLSPKTITNRHALLSAALAGAVQAGLIPANPARGVRLPETPHHEMVFLSAEEFGLLFAHVHPFWRPLILLLVGTGLRWGEATALQAGDFDLDLSRLHVRRAWKWNPGGPATLGTPKSKAGNRVVEFGPQVAAAVKPLVDGKRREAPVFLNRQGRQVRGNTFRNRAWLPAVAAAMALPSPPTGVAPGSTAYRKWARTAVDEPGERLTVEPRIHDLRHTFASWSLNDGVPIFVLSRVMGHKSLTMTADRYGHLQPDRISLAAEATSAALDLSGI